MRVRIPATGGPIRLPTTADPAAQAQTRLQRPRHIETALGRIAQQLETRPSVLLARIGLHLPDFPPRGAAETSREFTARVRAELDLGPGERPRTRKRSLYQMWTAIPADVRLDARRAGQAPRSDRRW